MTDVSYFNKGVVASPAGSVSSVTVPWPASVVNDQLALLVVVTQGFLFPTIVDTPDGWQVVDYRATFTGGIVVFSRSTVAGLPSVVVPVRSFFGDSISNIDAQIYVFNNTIRATKRGQGITIRPGNAGLWVTPGTFSGGTPSTIDTLPSHAVGLLISAGGQYFKPTQSSPSSLISSIELEARPGPAAPTVLSPSQESSTADPVVYRWLSNMLLPQTKFKIQVRTVGNPVWSYVKADGTLTTTVTEITSAQTSISSPSASYTPSTGYEFGIFTFDGTQWSPVSSTQIFSLVPPPVVTVSQPSAAIVNDLTPTVAWSSTFSGGRVQIAFQVTATAASGYLAYDSGVILGAQTSFTLPPQDDFVNGENVTFRVFVTQTGGATGTGSTTKSVSWTPPTNPTVAVANTGQGITVTIGADVDNVLDIQRSTDGSTWVDIGVSLPVRTPSPVVVHDVLAPYGVAVTYRVRASETLDATKLSTGWIVSSSITSTDTGTYLVDTLDALHFLQVRMREDKGLKYVRSGSTSYGLGASVPSADYGPLQGDSGQLVLRTRTQSEFDQLKAIVLLNRPVWLRRPPDDGIDVAVQRIAFTPDPIGHDRIAQSPIAQRDWPLTWVEQ